ncbi:MAG: cupin domain-containing protein [Janthinobacterium lividum]
MARPPLAELLDLQPHPEGGWFRRTWTSTVPVVPPGVASDVVRPTATAIHYLLCAGEESRWHRVRSDELWLHQRGAPLELRLGGTGEEPGAVVAVVLGTEVEAGQQPQVLVLAGTWQAAGPAVADVLVSCVVSPGFDFADWTLADAG